MFVNQYSSFFVVDVLLLGILMLPIVNFGAADADAKFPKTPLKCKSVGLIKRERLCRWVGRSQCDSYWGAYSIQTTGL